MELLTSCLWSSAANLDRYHHNQWSCQHTKHKTLLACRVTKNTATAFLMANAIRDALMQEEGRYLKQTSKYLYIHNVLVSKSFSRPVDSLHLHRVYIGHERHDVMRPKTIELLIISYVVYTGCDTTTFFITTIFLSSNHLR